jgi:hypothetical protein
MNRSVKLAVLAVGCVAAGSLATGLAVATTTTTTHPITLCVTKVGGVVTTPGSNGQCSKLQTAVQVASASDVAAIAARMDAVETANQSLTNQLHTDEQTISSQANVIASLSSRLDSDETTLNALANRFHAQLTATSQPADPGNAFYWTATGSNLEPGSPVILHETIQSVIPYSKQIGTADANGNLSVTQEFGCTEDSQIFFTGTDIFGHTVTSNTIATGAGC